MIEAIRGWLIWLVETIHALFLPPKHEPSNVTYIGDTGHAAHR